MQTNEQLICTEGLTYRYGRRQTILQDVALSVTRGSVYGFLGPNGSGKTTTLSLLLGLLKTQQGSVHLFGKALHTQRPAILKRIGTLVESPSLYGHLAAAENLEVYRPFYGAAKSRVGEVLELAGLGDTGAKPVKKFSLGMKQRLALALALLPRPELLILDEPTNGLDPQGIIEFRNLIRKLNREAGMTILVSSHILSEVEKMVSHVGILYKGRLLFQGTLGALQQLRQTGARLAIRTSDDHRAARLLQAFDPRVEDDLLTVPVTGAEQAAAVARLLVDNDLAVFLLQPQTPDLEQLFLQLTNQPV